MKIEKEVEEGAKETMKKGSTMTIIEEEEEAEGDKILIDQHHHKINLETNQNKEVQITLNIEEGVEAEVAKMTMKEDKEEAEEEDQRIIKKGNILTKEVVEEEEKKNIKKKNTRILQKVPKNRM